MKAMILAAGKSSRLGELGRHTPKPMLRLGGKPVLEWTLKRLRETGIREIGVNLHHSPEVIPGYFGDGAGLGVRLTYFVEEEILGTAGAVRNARTFLEDEPFLVVYGDNVLSWDPGEMLREHEAHRPVATIAVAEISDPSRSGVVRFDAEGRITAFHEKPGVRPELGRWVNAAVYVLEPGVFRYIPESGFADFGYDVLPRALGAGATLWAHLLEAPPLAIDTPEQYMAAQSAWGIR